MTDFLTTKQVVSQIDDIIRTSEKQLVLMSYSIKIDQTLFELIRDAHDRNVRITLVYGTEELKPDVKNQLQRLANLSLYFNSRLHAKCFFNEKFMVITSMNLYEYSANNWEMGILIDKERDGAVYDKAMREVKLVIGSSQQIQLRAIDVQNTASSKRVKSDVEAQVSMIRGHCLRCGVGIPLVDVIKPYCYTCFQEAKLNIDSNYVPIENYCLVCGRKSETSIDKPLCYSCYMKATS